MRSRRVRTRRYRVCTDGGTARAAGGTVIEESDLSFGEWLQQRRQALHLTQRQLADLARCSMATIRKLEAEERRPSPEVARLLATALQLPPAQHLAFERFAL